MDAKQLRPFLSLVLGLLVSLTPVFALAKNHKPLPEVVMLDDETEEPAPPPKKKGKSLAPAPTPTPELDPIEAEDVQAQSETPEDLDRVPVDADAPPKNRTATPPAAPSEGIDPFAAKAPAKTNKRQIANDDVKAKPKVTKPKTETAQKSAPKTSKKAEGDSIFGDTGDAQLPVNDPAAPTPVAPTPPNPTSTPVPAASSTGAAVTAPAAPTAASTAATASNPAATAANPAATAPTATTSTQKFSSFSTEVSEVKKAPPVAAPSNEIHIKPKAADAAVSPNSVRDPLAPPAGEDIQIDPSKLPRTLPQKIGTDAGGDAPVKVKAKKPKAAALKKNAKRKTASSVKKPKAVFEKAPAAPLDDDPDAPYQDPSLLNEQEDDVEEYTAAERDPAEERDGDVRTFRDTIRSIVDFNSDWEVNFVKNGRYRIRGQPNTLFDYQQSGQYLEIQVLESERRVISIQPIKVRFRQIR